jgi:hypothetical protein
MKCGHAVTATFLRIDENSASDKNPPVLRPAPFVKGGYREDLSALVRNYSSLLFTVMCRRVHELLVKAHVKPICQLERTRSDTPCDLEGTESKSGTDETLWLFSRRADFWLVCGGASLALLAAILVIYWHGDREINAVDFILSEFHLGATYDAVVRRRLWRARPIEVIVIPLLILSLIYWFFMSSQAVMLTSITMYVAVWHRGRQTLGIARFYQRSIGGPASRTHSILFRGAIYLPMVAATLAYTHLAPTEYDGEPYLALSVGERLTSIIGLAAVIWVVAYLIWTISRPRTLKSAPGNILNLVLHPGESWVVLAQAVAFGSGYVLGAFNASYLLVLAVHHEVQYLAFTCAMARRRTLSKPLSANSAIHHLDSVDLCRAERWFRGEANFIASFLFWPVIGFVGAVFGSWLNSPMLAPLGAGGLFCHYWLDGRIWRRPSAHV